MIVLDSSFLVAHHNERDLHHAAARAVMERLVAGEWGRALLLEYVFLEVITVLMARRGLPVTLSVATLLLQAAEVEFLPCSEFFLDSLDTFRNQGDAGLSFVDAAIVTAARKRAGGRVATFDRGIASLPGIAAVPAG